MNSDLLNLMLKKQNPKRRTKWTEDEKERLRKLFEKYDAYIIRVSKALNRGERAVRVRLYFMGLIREDGVN